MLTVIVIMEKNDLICDKHNIFLYEHDNSVFSLQLDISNPNIRIPSLINFDIYKLIATLNNDVVERIQITNDSSSNKKYILFVFKRFGSEIGISQKYMHTLVEKQDNVDEIVFTSKSTPLNNNIPNACELVLCKHSILTVNTKNPHNVSITYKFHMDLQEDLPIYMKNISGLLMKKIFIRLKTFIEKVS